ncbi:hypothetical protein [Caballeronia sp. SBC1]|uniref:hypothetical protein n=1 Tax=Caballeronia sp. SBC1 TaxID=2705548 RepID=UPI00140E557C
MSVNVSGLLYRQLQGNCGATAARISACSVYSVSSGSPLKNTYRLSGARPAIAVRVSTVALDLCGCSTTLSSAAKPEPIDGSFQNTSSATPSRRWLQNCYR